MTLSDLFRSSLTSLTRTKARSFLTMIGIVIGIMAVILMLSIGQAAERFILSQISALGSDVLSVRNGSSSQKKGEPIMFIKQTLTEKDVRALRLAPWVLHVAGGVSQQDRVGAEGVELSAQILGTTSDEQVLSDLHPDRGVFFSPSSVESHAREAVLGFEIADKLYGMNNPIGKTITLNDVRFRVIGTLGKEGSKNFQNVDRYIYIPFTTALDTYNRTFLSSIAVKTRLPLKEAKERITLLLRDRHAIDNPTGDPAKDDFTVATQEDAVKSAQQITNILKILLISIAAISLLVGGIGIMNIMYVSVTERVKEIGLRKSIGAREADILRQFLLEAILQTTLGGAIGTTLGIVLSWIAIQVMNHIQHGWTFAIAWDSVLLALIVSGSIGLVFGYFPARKAARLQPIEALRHE